MVSKFEYFDFFFFNLKKNSFWQFWNFNSSNAIFRTTLGFLKYLSRFPNLCGSSRNICTLSKKRSNLRYFHEIWINHYLRLVHHWYSLVLLFHRILIVTLPSFTASPLLLHPSQQTSTDKIKIFSNREYLSAWGTYENYVIVY